MARYRICFHKNQFIVVVSVTVFGYGRTMSLVDKIKNNNFEIPKYFLFVCRLKQSHTVDRPGNVRAA